MDRTVIKHVCVCLLRRLGVKSYDTQNGSMISIIPMDKGETGARRQSASQAVCQSHQLLSARHTRHTWGKTESDKHVAHPQRAQPAGLIKPVEPSGIPTTTQNPPVEIGWIPQEQALAWQQRVRTTMGGRAPSQECAYAQSTVTPFVLLRRARAQIKVRALAPGGGGRAYPRGSGGAGAGTAPRYCAQVPRPGTYAPVPSFFVGRKVTCGEAASPCDGQRRPRRADDKKRAARCLGRKDTKCGNQTHELWPGHGFLLITL